MPRPVPTAVLHFTHIRNLPGIITDGLLSDTLARASGSTQVEVGQPSLKSNRRERGVTIPPGGVVADYAPFYFAPRSPTMYSIHRGNVVEYQSGCGELIYLMSTLERLTAHGLTWHVTDRNAALRYAEVRGQGDLPQDHVDWDLTRETMWKNTPELPDRMERRMAECLVHQVVPWPAFSRVVTKTETLAERVRSDLASAGQQTRVTVGAGWYF